MKKEIGMQSVWKMAAVLWMAIAVAACSTTGGKPKDEAAVEDLGVSAGQEGGIGMDMGSQFQGMSLDDPASPLSRRTIYFDFDSFDVRAEDKEILAAHAAYLAANSQTTVTLEGHADEQGSREYNIGLGDRRAQAVRRLLEFQGALPSQIGTVSYGEEKPVDLGHDEAAWAQNRRVEIVYQ
jgi:peptidoglycan-associated lipoprotein